MNFTDLKSACEARGFELITASDKAAALSIAKGLIKAGSSVGLGGSESVKEIGLLDWLAAKSDITLFNQYEDGITMEENIRRRKQGMIADIYVTSVNAITEDGQLVNCDGEGNRVAAQIFGSERLLLIVGRNKVAPDIDAAFKRIEETAAPKNANRLNAKAATYGKTGGYTAQNMLKKYNIINADKPGRTTIIMVDEELGY